ncbi:MAG: hypothetical protein DHS20C17_26940 [Cyclobacteriaceae bacterium]|nr:MAG: hypothetical protein DHS20C17_26940 [Cyclobacteriaceae bacterium]
MKETQKSQVIADRKRELHRKSAQYKTAMTSDIDRLRLDISRIGKNSLLIVGSLYAAYKLSKLFTGSSSDEESNQQGIVKTTESSAMVIKIKEQIALFLLALAFKKLKEFLQESRNDNDENEDSKDTVR